MADKWSIIIAEENGRITFTLDDPNAAPNQSVGASKNDNVTWNNRTKRELTLKSLTPTVPYLTDPQRRHSLRSNCGAAVRHG